MRRSSDGTAGAMELHMHACELGSLLAEREAATRAPQIMRRNLSYLDRFGRRRSDQGSGPVLDLKLQAADTAAGPAANGQARAGSSSAAAAAGWAGGSSGAAKDVIVAALCVTVQCSDAQAFVPVIARALVVPHTPGGVLSLQLPLDGACCSGGSSSVPAGGPAVLHISGLSVLLIHQRNCQLASLVCLSSWERSSSSWRRAASGGKPLTPAVTASSAFQLLPSGTHVGYSVIPLDELLGSSSSSSISGKLQRAEGVLTTHLPAAAEPGKGEGGGGGARPVPCPWIQFQQQQTPQQQQGQQQQGQQQAQHMRNGSSGGSSGVGRAAQFQYTLRLRGAGSAGSGADQRHEAGAPGEAARAGNKRKAEAALGGAAAGSGGGRGGDAEQHQRNGVKPRKGAEAGGDQQGVQPPAPGPQQQEQGQQGQQGQHAQQQQQQQQRLTFYFSSFDGTRTARARLLGFACPHASCRGLRCHGYAALQQHMQATHSYHAYYFSDVMPDGGLEVYLRCKPAWCDAQGSFLPRQLATAALEAHPLSPLLARTHIARQVIYHCPRRQRRLRLPGSTGAYPRDKEEEALEAAAAEEQMAAEEEAAVAADPSSSAPHSSSMAATTLTADGGSVDGGSVAPRGLRPGSRAAGGTAAAAAAEAAATAAAAARRGKGLGAAAAAGRARGGRKPQAVHVRRQGQGLALLNHQGRPKFYHSKSCVAMTEEELLGATEGAEPNSEGELAEWQRDCRERLSEKSELCPEEREFMFEWNLWVHQHPIHADADLPAAVAAFSAAHATRLAAEQPFRRCLTAYLLNLWRFRLLMPQQLQQLAAGLPRAGPVAGVEAGA